jgi:hypothetical protein
MDSYMILENGVFTWKDLDGKAYMSWSGKTVAKLKPLIRI